VNPCSSAICGVDIAAVWNTPKRRVYIFVYSRGAQHAATTVVRETEHSLTYRDGGILYRIAANNRHVFKVQALSSTEYGMAAARIIAKTIQNSRRH
jgi:hypothetical protein